MSLLVSTKIYTAKGSGIRVVRDWRVMMIPDDNNTWDVLSLKMELAAIHSIRWSHL